MYANLICDLYKNADYHNKWPFDQYYISKFVFENKEKFVVFVPDVLNTPLGKVLRHNWLKNQKMYDDLKNLMVLKNEDICRTKFVEKDQYCNMKFPNTVTYGYEYFNEKK